MERLKYSEVDIPVYGGTIRIIRDIELFSSLMSEIDEDMNLEANTGITVQHYEDDDSPPIYYVGVFSGGEVTLIHELLHVTVMVIERSGFNVHDGNGEPAAYLLDYLFKMARKELDIKDV